MDEQRLLSDDPNAGRLLSTDPSAGQSSGDRPSGPKPVSANEPDTYWGGFLRSAGKTGADTLKGVGQGLLSTFDPRTYLAANEAKRTAEQQGIDEATGKRAPSTDHPMGQELKKLGQYMSTPEGGGNTIGSLASAFVVPPMARGAGRLITKGAAPVYESGLNRLPAMKAEFPNAVVRGIEEAIIPTPSNVQDKLRSAERETLQPIRAYDRANQPSVDPLIVAGKASGTAIDQGKLANRGIRQPALDEVNDLSQQFLGENTAPMTAERTLDLKRAEQSMANPAYRAAERGRPVGDVEQLWHKGTAGAARQELIHRVPEAADALSREQDLIGLLEGAERGANRPSAMRHITSVMGGGSILAAGHPAMAGSALLANELIGNPRVMGAAGIGLDRAGRALSSGTTAAAIRAMLLAKLRGDSTDLSPDSLR